MKTQVVAFTIKRGNRFLLGKRSPHKSIAPNYWCPISGKIEDNESEEQALIREAKEELGVLIKPLRKISTVETEERQSVVHWWLVALQEGEPILNNDEHTDLRWFTVEEISQLQPVFQEDLSVYRTLICSF